MHVQGFSLCTDPANLVEVSCYCVQAMKETKGATWHVHTTILIRALFMNEVRKRNEITVAIAGISEKIGNYSSASARLQKWLLERNSLNACEGTNKSRIFPNAVSLGIFLHEKPLTGHFCMLKINFLGCCPTKELQWIYSSLRDNSYKGNFL